MCRRGGKSLSASTSIKKRNQIHFPAYFSFPSVAWQGWELNFCLVAVFFRLVPSINFDLQPEAQQKCNLERSDDSGKKFHVKCSLHVIKENGWPFWRMCGMFGRFEAFEVEAMLRLCWGKLSDKPQKSFCLFIYGNMRSKFAYCRVLLKENDAEKLSIFWHEAWNRPSFQPIVYPIYVSQQSIMLPIHAFHPSLLHD